MFFFKFLFFISVFLITKKILIEKQTQKLKNLISHFNY